MPSSLLYLGVMLAVIILWFAFLKRPVYEAVLLSFLLLLTVTGNWGSVGKYIEAALSTPLLYSMVSFVAMSILLTKTKIVDSCITVILSLIGRVSGGAGYTAVIASAFIAFGYLLFFIFKTWHIIHLQGVQEKSDRSCRYGIPRATFLHIFRG